MVTEKEFQSIINYIQQECITNVPVNTNSPHVIEGMLLTMKSEKYQEWLKQHKPVKVKKRATGDMEEGFEVWWKTYPASANFTYKGVSYKSSRVLRSNRQVCEMLYQKAVVSSGATHEQMLDALKKQLKLAMQESDDKGQNKLEYWSGSEVYLRQAKYEAFLNMDSENIEEETDEDNNYA